MGYRNGNMGKAVSMPKGLFRGGVFCAIATVLGTGLLSKLVDMETLPWEMVGYGVMVMLFVTAFMGAKVAYYGIKRQKILVCLASGFVYFLLLMMVTALFFGAQYQAVGETGLLIAGGSLTAALLQNDRQRKKRRGI